MRERVSERERAMHASDHNISGLAVVDDQVPLPLIEMCVCMVIAPILAQGLLVDAISIRDLRAIGTSGTITEECEIGRVSS